MAVPTKGIPVQSAMRWLFETLLGNARHAVPFEYNSDSRHFGGGSENMKLLYSTCGYISNTPKGRERLINWYISEQGHGGGEPLTVSHCQLHIGGHGAIALYAHQNQDYQVRDLAIGWLAVEYHLLSLCEVNGEPWAPGARGVKKSKSGEITLLGSNPTRGKFLRAVREGKSPKPNQYDLGACCVARLPLEIRDWIAKKPDISSITIQGDLAITRLPNGTFATVFNSLPIREGGVQAAGYDGVESWIYRDASTPEAVVRIGQINLKLGKDAIVEHYRSPDVIVDSGRKRRKEKPMSGDKTNAASGKPNAASIKTPTTCAELYAAADLPYEKGNVLISQADKSLVVDCFTKLYPRFGHTFMHATDHNAALVILLGREPTYRQVQDSAHLHGSRNIDAARIKSGTGGDSRPSGWDDWNDEQKRYHVLVHLYGMVKGGKIFDGKIKQSEAEKLKTEALMVLWGLKVEPIEPDRPPVEPDKPIDPDQPPTPLPAEDISIEIHVTIAGQKRIYRGVERSSRAKL